MGNPLVKSFSEDARGDRSLPTVWGGACRNPAWRSCYLYGRQNITVSPTAGFSVRSAVFPDRPRPYSRASSRSARGFSAVKA